LASAAAVIATACLTSWAWVYVSPWDPNFSAHELDSRQQHNYWPGGADCDPKQLDALPAQKAPSERKRCAVAVQDEHENQAALNQAVRANELAKQGLRISAQQARAAFIQTIATVLAFGAAALAAVFAGFAAWHAKRSADADNDALKEIRAIERPFPYAAIDFDTVKDALKFAVDAPDTDSTRAIVSFCIKNYGKTPAIILNVAAEVAVQRTTPYARDRRDDFPVSETVIGPGDESKPMNCKMSEFITCEDHFAMQRGESRLLFTGWITYRDIRGESDTTPFGWEYDIHRGKWMTLENQANPKPKTKK